MFRIYNCITSLGRAGCTFKVLCQWASIFSIIIRASWQANKRDEQRKNRREEKFLCAPTSSARYLSFQLFVHDDNKIFISIFFFLSFIILILLARAQPGRRERRAREFWNIFMQQTRATSQVWFCCFSEPEKKEKEREREKWVWRHKMPVNETTYTIYMILIKFYLHTRWTHTGPSPFSLLRSVWPSLSLCPSLVELISQCALSVNICFWRGDPIIGKNMCCCCASRRSLYQRIYQWTNLLRRCTEHHFSTIN